jgi:hypothetical protein
MPEPLSETEKAYFDTIRQVATSPRPEDIGLHRMTLDGRDVAVVAHRVLDSTTAVLVGYQPLAILIDDETAARLRDADGKPTRPHRPEGLEGAA